ncbi:MAG: hypothetical protein NTW14_07595 [bacterium]|nr:hypothetical protein [bacterium]
MRKAVKLLRREEKQKPGEIKKVWAAFFTDAASAVVESSCRELRLTRAEKRELHLD